MYWFSSRFIFPGIKGYPTFCRCVITETFHSSCLVLRAREKWCHIHLSYCTLNHDPYASSTGCHREFELTGEDGDSEVERSPIKYFSEKCTLRMSGDTSTAGEHETWGGKRPPPPWFFFLVYLDLLSPVKKITRNSVLPPFLAEKCGRNPGSHSRFF